MSDYTPTPTTEEIRRNWAFTKAGDRIHRTQEYYDQFDRWLAQHEAELRERIAANIEALTGRDPLADYGLEHAARAIRGGGDQ